jgi:Fuc2NAc and GlcNAc transferase
LLLALLGGGIPLAWIGFLDDRRSVSVGARLLVHFASAGWAVYILGGLGPLQIGARVVHLGIAGDVLAISAVMWTVNLFNFMDGIDGIAGAEATFVAVAGGALATAVFGTPGVMGAGTVFAGACLGFLAWNWPPAKIFMGDAGSGFLGFFIAALALASARTAPAAIFVWVVLGGVFFVDATVTFARRLLRGARVHQAHREHAYQWLSRRWASHRTTVLATMLLNLCWLGPWAWYAAKDPAFAAWACLAALGPLVVIAIVAGAGKPE